MAETSLARLRARLNRGESWLTYDVGRLFARDGLGEDAVEELETRLLQADAGVEAAQHFAERLRIAIRQGRVRDAAALRALLRELLTEWLRPCERPLDVGAARPFVVLGVGVNGVGKTTTLGKLAHRWTGEGRSVLLAAGDTFRAAAAEQLREWAQRAGAPLVAQAAGADAASVLFDALQAARARDTDVLVADTAGRLHTQAQLMDELKKVQRVLRKLDPGAPHEVLLVLDATTGQNALRQAETFHAALGVTGLVLTKLDGTAKGGIVLAIAHKLALPIRYVGVGEDPADLLPFDAAQFADALLG
ncbi:MAG TPA: signal recognition particle-docking protein FtsY [Candidatus Binatia bacterium]|nr:signal recognition particle-docking protein FtsY [Candidatus Binatia bacterium]